MLKKHQIANESLFFVDIQTHPTTVFEINLNESQNISFLVQDFKKEEKKRK